MFTFLFSALSYLGLATDVQTQDAQLLVKENLVDDKKVEEDVDEEEDEEDGEADEEQEEDESLDFLQNFPNFYSMAADIMNQLDGQIPEVLDIYTQMPSFEIKNCEKQRKEWKVESLRDFNVSVKNLIYVGAAYKKQFSDWCSGSYNGGQSVKLYKQYYKGIFEFVLFKHWLNSLKLFASCALVFFTIPKILWSISQSKHVFQLPVEAYFLRFPKYFDQFPVLMRTPVSAACGSIWSCHSIAQTGDWHCRLSLVNPCYFD